MCQNKFNKFSNYSHKSQKNLSRYGIQKNPGPVCDYANLNRRLRKFFADKISESPHYMTLVYSIITKTILKRKAHFKRMT